MNMIANPDFTPETIVIIPGTGIGRGAALDGDRVVFDGNGNAPFATFANSGGTIFGHTYSVGTQVDSLTGTLNLYTTGDTPQHIGTITASATTPQVFTFVADGTESGYMVTGNLHGCVARFGDPDFED